MANSTERRGRGPEPGTPTEKATILLEPDLKSWGKKQPGGLSEFVRGLMRDAYTETEHLSQLTALASERLLSREWNTIEEDLAWQHL